MDINDFKLELVTLQQKDKEDAIKNGFTNKDSWFMHIIKEPNDEVAEAIVSLAKRYDIDENIVAKYFDPTMLIRISKIKKRVKEITN